MKRVLKFIRERLCIVLCRDEERLQFEQKHPNTPVVSPMTVGTFYSQEGQDLFLAGLLFPLIERYKGVPYFLDIGCNHPEKFSNSLFFERYLGFRTIGVDPLEEYGQLWKRVRPAARFEAVGVGASSGVGKIQVPKDGSRRDDMFSSFVVDDTKTAGCELAIRDVEITTIAKLVRKYDISEVLICSIDVEGYELEVLEGIDFDSLYVVCFCIENDSKGDYGCSDIRDFMEEKGYVFYARLGKRDDVFLHRTVCGRTVL